jgi:uncharacterized protein YcfJ
MNHQTPRFTTKQTASALAAIAVLGLAGCAYPVYEQRPAPAPAEVRYYDNNPPPQQARDYRRRNNETLYQADVLTVRAVMGQTEQRCWIEREAVPPPRPAANVPGAIIGGVIGGILGHQIGSGTGQDIATVGGVVAGAAIGSNVGRDRYGNPVATQDVQHCSNQPVNSEPAYWDVTYQFRGVTHRVQMLSQPGRSITVNADGEPRD